MENNVVTLTVGAIAKAGMTRLANASQALITYEDKVAEARSAVFQAHSALHWAAIAAGEVAHRLGAAPLDDLTDPRADLARVVEQLDAQLLEIRQLRDRFEAELVTLRARMPE